MSEEPAKILIEVRGLPLTTVSIPAKEPAKCPTCRLTDKEIADNSLSGRCPDPWHADERFRKAGLVIDDDIVLCLRWNASFGISGNIYELAADEIERLRAEVKRLGPMGGEKEPSSP